MANIGTTHQTALCIIPPENLWKSIQMIRSIHDKAYARWMPHINLIYPFFPESEFDQVKEKLERVLEEQTPFDIEFDQSCIQYFKQKGQQCTFHLRPKISAKTVQIQNQIQNALFKSADGTTPPFEAHLTLGQTTTSRISDVLIEMKSKWTPIKFTVDRLAMISRENDPNEKFTIKKQIFLLGRKKNADERYTPEEPVEEVPREPILTATPTINKKSRSSAIPVKFFLCIIPPNEFSTRLLHLFEEIPSFIPTLPFRIVLQEYDQHPNESELDRELINVSKFTLDFGPKSICFNYTSVRLFLKPTTYLPAIPILNVSDQSDNTMTLGSLDKKDLTAIGDLYTQRWTYGTNEFEVDRLHLLDNQNRFQASFRLRNQCFS